MNVKIAAALLALPAVLQAQTIRAGLPQVHAIVADASNKAITVPVLVSEPVQEAYGPLARQSGSIVVEYTVDTTGQPQDLHLVQALNKATDERVLAAVKQYHYQPGTLNGKAIDFPVRLTVDFKQ